MSKEKIRIILTVLLGAVFLVSMGMSIRQRIEYRESIAVQEEAARLAGLHDTASFQRPAPAPPAPAVETEEPEPEPLPEEALALAEIDLEALRAVNEEVVGWIVIPDTMVSHPLVQGADNDYYLSHNWKKRSDGSGAIFLDCAASRDLTDFHTIVYGHQMYNGTMFSTLVYYKDPDHWRQHPSVYAVLSDGVYRYDIFSAQEVGVRSVIFWLEKEKYRLEEAFLQYCTQNSAIETGSTPNAGQRILTLSTCADSGDTSRWVVHGMLAGKYSRTDG